MKVPGVQRVRDRFARPPREEAEIRVPVRFRVARAVGTAASAIPESRAVKMGTAVATVVAAHPNIVRAGLTAASAVPVLRPYVKVAVAATSVIAVARRLAEARSAATDVVATLRSRPGSPGMAYAGNEFGLGSAAEPIVLEGEKAALPTSPAASAEPVVPAAQPAEPAAAAAPPVGTAPSAEPTSVPAPSANPSADTGRFANPASYLSRSAGPVPDAARYANPAAFRAQSASPAIPAQASDSTAAEPDRPEEVDRPTLLQRMHRRMPRASRGTDAATTTERGREP
jgi:hypothetical protein